MRLDEARQALTDKAEIRTKLTALRESMASAPSDAAASAHALANDAIERWRAEVHEDPRSWVRPPQQLARLQRLEARLEELRATRMQTINAPALDSAERWRLQAELALDIQRLDGIVTRVCERLGIDNLPGIESRQIIERISAAVAEGAAPHPSAIPSGFDERDWLHEPPAWDADYYLAKVARDRLVSDELLTTPERAFEVGWILRVLFDDDRDELALLFNGSAQPLDDELAGRTATLQGVLPAANPLRGWVWFADVVPRGPFHSERLRAEFEHTTKRQTKAAVVRGNQIAGAMTARDDADRRTWALPILDSILEIARAAVPAGSSDNAGTQAQERSEKIDPDQSVGIPRHNEDYTFVCWCGSNYSFAPGAQARVVGRLWQEWAEFGGNSRVSKSVLQEVAESNADDFRVSKVFRHNPAYGSMIRELGSGQYGLRPPNWVPAD